MKRRTLLGLVAAVGSTTGCLESHPLPPVRGRVVRTSVVGVKGGTAITLLRATPDRADIAPEMRNVRASVAADDAESSSNEADFSSPLHPSPRVNDALRRRFDAVRYCLTVDHDSPVHLYGVSPGERLQYRTRLEVFRNVIPADRILFTIAPGESPRFKNATTVLRTGTVTRKRLRAGAETAGGDADLRTILTATADGVGNGDGPDVSLPLSERRLTALHDQFETVRLLVDVDHGVGDLTFARRYHADRSPFNRLSFGDPTRFAITDDDRIPTLDPDSPFYAQQPW